VRINVYVPLLIALLLAVVGPALARRLSPRAETWVLTGAALVAAVGWLGSLGLLAVSGLRSIPVGVASAGAAALLCALVGLVVSARRRGRVLLAAFTECRRSPATDADGGDLLVVDDPQVEAFALPGPPGIPGRVVVTTGMLHALEPAEREALMAHERAHLRERHHFFLLVLHLSAAACPLLRPLAKEGAYAVERWADEDAAQAVGDRGLVARAVARAALAQGSSPAGPWRNAALAATGGPVPRRVRSLLAPPLAPRPAQRMLALATFALLLALCCACLGDAGTDALHLFHGAVAAHRAVD